MKAGYSQFCPIAKASEILAARWTPLILRELMTGSTSFGEIHSGVPLISRAVLVERLRELEYHGVIERCPRANGSGHSYRLTAAGDAFRPVVEALGQWGLVHARHRITAADLDPSILVWGLRARAALAALPSRRVVIRFEFLSVPAVYRKYRILWLLLERSGVDACAKDPGFPVDLIFRGKISDFIAVFLGHASWREMQGRVIDLEGDKRLAQQVVSWLQLDSIVGRDLPLIPPA